MKKKLLLVLLSTLFVFGFSAVGVFADDITTESTLTTAITNAESGTTITLAGDITTTSKISITKQITLDLGGKTLTIGAVEGLTSGTSGNIMVINGTLTSSQDDFIAANGGMITLGEGLKVSCTSSAIYAYNKGTVNINGAEVTITNANYAGAFATGADSSVNIISGKLAQTGTNRVTLSIASGASSTISGGEVSSTHSTTISAKGTNATITITGGTVSTTSEYVAGWSANEGKIVVNGGTITSNGWEALSAIHFGLPKGGSLEISGGEINKAVGAYEGNDCSLTITGGAIGSNPEAWAVYIKSGASATISGGTIKGFVDVASGETGTVSVSGGTFEPSVLDSYIDTTNSIETKNYDGTYTVGSKVTVTFDSDGGSEVAALDVAKESTIAAPTAPTKEGYTFNGWYEGDATTAFAFPATITKDVSLKAKWTPVSTGGGTTTPPTKGDVRDIKATDKASAASDGTTTELVQGTHYNLKDGAVEFTDDYLSTFSGEREVTLTINGKQYKVKATGTIPTDADKAKAADVEKLINALPDPVTEADADKVKAARDAYDKLTAIQQSAIPAATLAKLTTAESAIATINAEKEAQAKYEADVTAAKALTVKITKAKNAKGKKVKVTFKPSAAAKASATGYQVKYGLNKKVTKKAKTKTLKKATAKSLTVKKLKKGKTYYFKVRTYTEMTNPSTGAVEKVYGKWSKVTKVKVKK